MLVDKKVKLTLVIGDNAFALIGAWANQANKEGWTKEEKDAVIKEATSGDYDHLLVTLSEHCDVGGDDEGDTFDNEESEESEEDDLWDYEDDFDNAKENWPDSDISNDKA
jgi:hypothetical protein